MKKSQKQTIYDMLSEADEEGITTIDMINQYIPKYTNRISELRQEGHNIQASKIPGKNYCRYVLK